MIEMDKTIEQQIAEMFYEPVETKNKIRCASEGFKPYITERHQRKLIKKFLDLQVANTTIRDLIKKELEDENTRG